MLSKKMVQLQQTHYKPCCFRGKQHGGSK
jgi:hypothetical protein